MTFATTLKHLFSPSSTVLAFRRRRLRPPSIPCANSTVMSCPFHCYCTLYWNSKRDETATEIGWGGGGVASKGRAEYPPSPRTGSSLSLHFVGFGSKKTAFGKASLGFTVVDLERGAANHYKGLLEKMVPTRIVLQLIGLTLLATSGQ